MRLALFAASLVALVACGKDDTSGGTGTPAPTGTEMATCADFCALYTTTCTDALSEFADEADCNTQCGSWEMGTPGDQARNTLECRWYHLNAASSDAATHCPHAGPSGGGVCV